MYHHADPRISSEVTCDSVMEALSLVGGLLLFFVKQELPYQSLWLVTAEGMIANGASLSFGPYSWWSDH